jgi:hypothetical protein
MRIKISLLIVILVFLCTEIYAENKKFTGFWKENCTDAFGVQIKPYDDQLYSVSFCGPGGCHEPGKWRPNTAIKNDPDYRIINNNLIEINHGITGWSKYKKCTSDTNPVLDYSTMKGTKRRATRTFQPGRGLPNYEEKSPFVDLMASVYTELREEISSTKVSPIECDAGSAVVPGLSSYPLKTNVCRKADFKRIKSIIAKLAPSLDEKKLTFWVKDYNADGEHELLVEHIDISNDQYFEYPYLSLWMLQYVDKKYRSIYAGPFLAGEIHAIRPFGHSKGNKMVFVKHLSCIACEPWVYLTIVDFSKLPAGDAFQFTYYKDHSGFGYEIEYELPGMGHSIDAEVDSRIPPVFNESGPHLIQNFDIKDGGEEWWIFTCKGYKCDYEMHVNQLPQEYIKLWENAEKL